MTQGHRAPFPPGSAGLSPQARCRWPCPLSQPWWLQQSLVSPAQSHLCCWSCGIFPCVSASSPGLPCVSSSIRTPVTGSGPALFPYDLTLPMTSATTSVQVSSPSEVLGRTQLWGDSCGRAWTCGGPRMLRSPLCRRPVHPALSCSQLSRLLRQRGPHQACSVALAFWGSLCLSSAPPTRSPRTAQARLPPQRPQPGISDHLRHRPPVSR